MTGFRGATFQGRRHRFYKGGGDVGSKATTPADDRYDIYDHGRSVGSVLPALPVPGRDPGSARQCIYLIPSSPITNNRSTKNTKNYQVMSYHRHRMAPPRATLFVASVICPGCSRNISRQAEHMISVAITG